MSFQTLVIVGYLGRDPDMKYTPAGQAVANFNLAVNRQYAETNGQAVKETAWFKIAAWGKTAENCSEFLHKGSLVLVEGRLVCDPETGGPRVFNRQDGTPGTAFEVSANTVRFLSTKGDAGETESAPAEKAGTEVPF